MHPAPVRERVAKLNRPLSSEVAFPRLLTERARATKRTVDLVCAVLLALAALPLMVLIALAVRLTSRGPVFYAHERVGRGGKPFRVWKFRTMFAGADAILARYLAEHPEHAYEWELNHKLKQDPRVTVIGRLLRRTSLDEMPQIVNVLKGEMSMVGPRPIVAAEAARYGSAFRLYKHAKPGITGLWQVSGRNNTTYRRRVELDSEYIRNWTPRTDLRILARTFGVVLTGKGAY